MKRLFAEGRLALRRRHLAVRWLALSALIGLLLVLLWAAFEAYATVAFNLAYAGQRRHCEQVKFRQSRCVYCAPADKFDALKEPMAKDVASAGEGEGRWVQTGLNSGPG